MDSLFTFEPPIGEDYSGAWRDDSTFVVTLLAVGDAAPALGEARAIVAGAIHDAAMRRPSAAGNAAVLSGNYGVSTPPQIVSFVADDPGDGDSAYGAGDTLTITLDQATDRGGANASSHGNMSFVDGLFAFSTPLGSRYSGEWRSDSVFVVTVLEVDPSAALGTDPASAPGSAPPSSAPGSPAAFDVPQVGISEVSLTNTSNLRNRASTAAPAIGIPVELEGDFGSAAPRLASLRRRARARTTRPTARATRCSSSSTRPPTAAASAAASCT